MKLISTYLFYPILDQNKVIFVPPPPPQRGKGEDAPSENCAKKRRVGRKYVHLFTPFCTEVTSLCAPLEIGGHTDRIGKNSPAPVAVKIEGGGTGEEWGDCASGLTPRHRTNRRVLPATPAANAGNNRRARPHGVAVGWRAAPVCPVGVWCGAQTSLPRTDRTHNI